MSWCFGECLHFPAGNAPNCVCKWVKLPIFTTTGRRVVLCRAQNVMFLPVQKKYFLFTTQNELHRVLGLKLLFYDVWVIG